MAEQTWSIPADRQAVFDRVWWHLRAQRTRATLDPDYEGAGGCWYRTPDGRACAIGCMIPDGHAALESSAFLWGLKGEYPALFEPGCDFDFLGDLQKAHDYAFDNKFRVRLEAVAAKHGLTTPLQRGEKAPTP